MSKEILFGICVMIVKGALAQSTFTPEEIKATKLPEKITYSEQFAKAVTWQQHDTTHYVVLSETNLKLLQHTTSRSARVAAHHFTSLHDSVNLEWQVKDGIAECEVDFHAYFVPNAFSVTDLDKDGTPEIWLMYSTACRGDVSPSTLKIIMYEGSKKHAMRGRMLINYSATEHDGGEYTFDAAFTKAPAKIRHHAMDLWKRYREEKW